MSELTIIFVAMAITATITSTIIVAIASIFYFFSEKKVRLGEDCYGAVRDTLLGKMVVMHCVRQTYLEHIKRNAVRYFVLWIVFVAWGIICILVKELRIAYG